MKNNIVETDDKMFDFVAQPLTVDPRLYLHT